MGEEVFRLVATGLLAVIAVQLIFTVALLGRLNRKLEAPRSAQAETATQADEPDEPESQETPAPAEVEPPVETSPPGTDTAEGPYEKDGRWWYRQDDELLVYDDRTEQWVVPELHPLEEARGWDTASVEPAAPVSSPPVETAPVEPAPAPVEPTPAPVAATPEPVSAAPIPEPVDPPAPIATGEAAEDDDSPQMAAHWKCPACGVINGSAATSCRMCFAARP